MKVIAGIIEPPGAIVKVSGRIAPMIELGAGFDGELSGRENIRLSCMLMGLSASEVSERMEQIINFSELRDHIELPLKNYSSGMQARLGFACATSVDPDVLLVDEVLSVGDTNFARKCLRRIDELRERGTTTVLVSHDEGTVRRFCSRGYVLNQGKIISEGTTDEALKAHADLMNQKYLETLNEADRKVFLRKRQLEESERLTEQQSEIKKPIVEAMLRFTQDGSEVSTIDFAKKFEVTVRYQITNTSSIEGSFSVGVGINTSTGLRLGGFNNLEQKFDIPPPAEGIQEEISFQFNNGIPMLTATTLEVVFGIHDRHIGRTLAFGHAAMIVGKNSKLGLNVDGDLINLCNFVSKIELRKVNQV